MAEISHGQVNLNTVLGAIGTAGAVAPGILGNLFGGMGGNNCYNNCNSESVLVNRYEAAQSAQIARLETEVKLRDANTFTMNALNDLRSYTDRRLERLEGAISQQAVHNATSDGVIACLTQQVAALNALTQTVIPASHICPTPMPQFNSWTAPTTTTTGA